MMAAEKEEFSKMAANSRAMAEELSSIRTSCKDKEEECGYLQQLKKELSDAVHCLKQELEQAEKDKTALRDKTKELTKLKLGVVSELKDLEAKAQVYQKVEEKVLLLMGIAGIELSEQQTFKIEEILTVYKEYNKR